MPRGWSLAFEQGHLVVTVQMILVTAVSELHALEELVVDVRIAGSGQESRKPVEAGEDAILDRAWLDVTRPAGDARHAEAAFADSTFGVLKRRHAAVRPGEHFRAVVGAEDDNGVIGF